MITQTLVTSQLDYCNILYMGMSLKTIQVSIVSECSSSYGISSLCICNTSTLQAALCPYRLPGAIQDPDYHL